MPQGTVVAIKPMSYVSQSTLMSASVSGTTQTGTSSTREGGSQESRVLYLVGVYKENSPSGNLKKVESLVWFEGSAGDYKRKDVVEFEIDTRNPKTIHLEQAVKVHKIGSEKLFKVGGSLLSIVALFASVLLLVAVTVENRR
ncbi:hypothetical protein ACFS7Z_03605 [Pontibacter toksunensis]|uniref:Uncharacterized protein n=1 Tax=Pontibacter toksunensis TaxID=1332631 RepID=A0ABW6BNW5_9BACT